MKYVKRSDKFSFIEKDNKVTIRKNLWGKNSPCSSKNLFQKISWTIVQWKNECEDDGIGKDGKN